MGEYCVECDEELTEEEIAEGDTCHDCIDNAITDEDCT